MLIILIIKMSHTIKDNLFTPLIERQSYVHVTHVFIVGVGVKYYTFL